MAAKKRLLRGIDDFKSLISQNGYFVDKTLLIKEVLDNEHQVMLLPRPRRFGKSMNISMLANFFDVNEKDNAPLFKPYKIWKTGKKYTEQQGKYPVIVLSLKDIKETTFENALEFLKEMLSDLFAEHDYLLESKELKSWEKKDILKIIEKEASTTICKRSLKKLSGYLSKHHQEKVVILIDEYDSPIHVAYRNAYYKEMVGFMKAFLGGALKTNRALYKGVLTGILRVSKESIFSDLKNIEVYSVLNQKFADKFGFTEAETKLFLKHFNLNGDFELVKQWYDGYTIGQVQDIYNPWSITGYIGSHQEGFRAHWVNTSADELIKERIVEKSAKEIRSDIETLLLGETISKPIDENIVFSDFESRKELLWSLLVFSGYLTIVKEEKKHIYSLTIPNYEIKTLFSTIIWNWFEIGLDVTTSLLLKMIQSLTENRIKEFEKHFRAIMGDTFSYFDIGQSDDEEAEHKQLERVWQAYTLGVLSIASEDYIIKSNRESGEGRYDILLLPKVKTKYGIIIEVKTMRKKSSQAQIDKQLQKALNQIEKNEYYKELIAHDIPKRIEIAMVFVGKKVHILPKNS